MKQHLEIKRFFGRSPNAVKTQVWIAVCVYLLTLILKKNLKLSDSPYEILQILSVIPFEKTPIVQVFSQFNSKNQQASSVEQLSLLRF